MDEKERDEILYRLDEGTKRVEGHLNRIDSRLGEIEDTVDDHEARISDNEDIIETYNKMAGGAGAALLAAITGAAAKIMGLIRLL